jgi:hypothetical protein
MLGGFQVAAQLVASPVALSSMELVISTEVEKCEVSEFLRSVTLSSSHYFTSVGT